jgi:CrcB protein
VLTEMLALKLHLSHEARAFLTTGILGGFTTFSAFSLDFAYLVERKEVLAAGGYVLASVVLSLLAVLAGMSLIRTIYAA